VTERRQPAAKVRTAPRTIRTTPPAGCGQCRLSILRFRCPERELNAAQVRPAADQERRRPGGTFTGLASVFDNVDHHGDIVRRGAFAKSLSSGSPIPLLWEHKSDDPRNFVGDVVEATEVDRRAGPIP
jgi:hypothetical protein